MRSRAFFVSVLFASFVSGLAGAADTPQGAARLEQGQLLRGHFEQERILKGFDAPLKSAGSFVLAPGQGLIWRAETPFPLTTVMTPAGLMQEIDGRETMRLPSAKIPFMTKMYAMLSGALTGDWSALSSAFTVSRKDSGKGWTLELVPLKADDPAMPITKIVAHGGKLLDDVEVIKIDGDRDRLVFSGQALGKGELAADEAELLASAAQL